MPKIYFSLEKNSKIIICLFFLVYFFIGVSVFDDYGTHFDEIVDHNFASVTVAHIFGEENNNYSKSFWKYYGPAFELVRYGIQKGLNLTDMRNIFLMRHFLMFLIFFGASICFYKICQNRFRSWKMGLLGSLFLILSPRIFAHSFYNNKDLVFLSFFIIAIYSAVRYLECRNFRWALGHALACGVLIDLRIVGIFIPVVTTIFFFFDFIVIPNRRKFVERQCLSFMCYGGLLICFVILFWPLLWENPFVHFWEAFNQMRRFPWRGNVLYFGEQIRATKLPWHYIPVWLSITTPLSYLFFFIMGCLNIVSGFFLKPLDFYRQRREDMFFLSCFFIPLLAVIILKSTLYDSWRHMFFIYPGFLMLALIGIRTFYLWFKKRFGIWHWKLIGVLFFLCVVGNMVSVAWFMIKYHPHQNVYFNRLAGKNMADIKQDFELDYWGTSYKQALEYIVEHDKSPSIPIYVLNLPGEFNKYMLKKKDRDRLVYVKDQRKAKYFVSNFRSHKDEYTSGGEYFSIKVRGVNIMVVYKKD